MKPGVTSVDAGEFSPEVNQGWEFADSVLLGVAGIVDLHEGDVQGVRLVVDLLQAGLHLVALYTVVLVF